MAERGTKRGLSYDRRILVTGDSGFFGNNLKKFLEDSYPTSDIIYSQGRKFFDLTRPNHVDTMFKAIQTEGYVDWVIHLAGYSGGMFENMERPASFWYQNTMLITNMLEACAQYKVKKLLIPFGGCSYPDIPDKDMFSEEDLWEGFPHVNSYGYSMAKKQAVIGAMVYGAQTKSLNTLTVIPTNPIGPWDNVDQKQAHVPAALIGRFLEAKREGYSAVTVFGSGKPERDFLFIDDIVKLFPLLLLHWTGKIGDQVSPMNISSGKGTTIRELAETIAKVVGYTGKIHFDKSKPDGQMRKVLDNSKLLSFLQSHGRRWEPTPLEEAIGQTVEWYVKRVKA